MADLLGQQPQRQQQAETTGGQQGRAEPPSAVVDQDRRVLERLDKAEKQLRDTIEERTRQLSELIREIKDVLEGQRGLFGEFLNRLREEIGQQFNKLVADFQAVVAAEMQRLTNMIAAAADAKLGQLLVAAKDAASAAQSVAQAVKADAEVDRELSTRVAALAAEFQKLAGFAEMTINASRSAAAASVEVARDVAFIRVTSMQMAERLGAVERRFENVYAEINNRLQAIDRVGQAASQIADEAKRIGEIRSAAEQMATEAKRLPREMGLYVNLTLNEVKDRLNQLQNIEASQVDVIKQIGTRIDVIDRMLEGISAQLRDIRVNL